MPAPIPAGRTRAREGYDDTDDECELKSTIVGPKALLQYLCMAHCNLPYEDMIIPNKVKVIVNQRLNTMANHNSFCVYLRKTVHALLNCGHEKLFGACIAVEYGECAAAFGRLGVFGDGGLYNAERDT